MKMNPQKVTALVRQGSSNLVATSRDLLRRFDPGASQNATDLTTYDESILQQGRFWMRTVTWSLIGTTVFGVAWLALARTEEIVVAPGQLEPVDSVQDIQMNSCQQYLNVGIWKALSSAASSLLPLERHSLGSLE